MCRFIKKHMVLNCLQFSICYHLLSAKTHHSWSKTDFLLKIINITLCISSSHFLHKVIFGRVNFWKVNFRINLDWNWFRGLNHFWPGVISYCWQWDKGQIPQILSGLFGCRLVLTPLESTKRRKRQKRAKVRLTKKKGRRHKKVPARKIFFN